MSLTGKTLTLDKGRMSRIWPTIFLTEKCWNWVTTPELLWQPTEVGARKEGVSWVRILYELFSRNSFDVIFWGTRIYASVAQECLWGHFGSLKKGPQNETQFTVEVEWTKWKAVTIKCPSLTVELYKLNRTRQMMKWCVYGVGLLTWFHGIASLYASITTNMGVKGPMSGISRQTVLRVSENGSHKPRNCLFSSPNYRTVRFWKW